jgi:thiol-disulfide isomerase/thioredoxin
MRGIALLSVALLVTGCGAGGFQPSDKSYVEGTGVVTLTSKSDRRPAPNIAGISLTGASVKIEPGKVALINVWASWCAPCRAEAPILQELSQDFPNVQFFGLLTRDSQESAKAFSKKFKISYPTISDDKILLDFRNSLPVAAIPTTFLIDKDGKVAARILGEIKFSSLKKLIEQLESE